MVRIQFRTSRDAIRRSLLACIEKAFLLGGCLMIAICALFYFEAKIYQASQSRLFESASRLNPREPIAASETIPPSPQPGSPVSKIEIPRLGISAVVIEGVRPEDLRVAAGHVPGTALPGERGNVAIAAHRDTFFRNLSGIRGRDTITLTTLNGSYEYLVESTQVVDPTDVQILDASPEPVLTLITCYPFYYIGAAPKRFIVRARQD